MFSLFYHRIKLMRILLTFSFFFFLKNAFCFYFYFCKSFASLLCSYFLDNAERICNTNYIPTVKDILHARLKTTGASELKFEVKQHKFLVIDVGGQRCQRTQWYIMAKPKWVTPSIFRAFKLIPKALNQFNSIKLSFFARGFSMI